MNAPDFSGSVWPTPTGLSLQGQHAYRKFLQAHGSPTIPNAFTVDLEDWAHGLMGGATPITDRVVRNVDRVLRLLEARGIQATFFALGKVCEKFPSLLPEIVAAGHEVGSHGYGHDLLFRMTPRSFREDLRRSIDVIGCQIGRAPLGYRAPAFSITRQSLWAGPILAELGFAYSSSVFPIRGRRYGIAGAPAGPFRWREWSLLSPGQRRDAAGLLEFPLTTLRWAGHRWPVSGGGYLRLLPSDVLAAALRQAHRRNQPGVVYMHPYELDVHEVRDLQRAGWRFPTSVAFCQRLFRSRFGPRINRLCASFRFAPMGEVLAAGAKIQENPGIQSAKHPPPNIMGAFDGRPGSGITPCT